MMYVPPWAVTDRPMSWPMWPINSKKTQQTSSQSAQSPIMDSTMPGTQSTSVQSAELMANTAISYIPPPNGGFRKYRPFHWRAPENHSSDVYYGVAVRPANFNEYYPDGPPENTEPMLPVLRRRMKANPFYVDAALAVHNWTFLAAVVLRRGGSCIPLSPVRTACSLVSRAGRYLLASKHTGLCDLGTSTVVLRKYKK